MYGFHQEHGKREKRRHSRILTVVIIILLILLGVVSYSYIQLRNTSAVFSQALMDRVMNEAGEAKEAAYRLTQSSGTSSMTYLSTVRAHIYALESLNQLSQNVNGPDAVLVDTAKLSTCESIISDCELRLQAGGVLTEKYTELKDSVDAIANDYTNY